MELPIKGICDNCVEKKRCPMPWMIKEWNHIVKQALPNKPFDYEYDEYYIDEPEFKDNIMQWCPMYFADKRII